MFVCVLRCMLTVELDACVGGSAGYVVEVVKRDM